MENFVIRHAEMEDTAAIGQIWHKTLQEKCENIFDEDFLKANSPSALALRAESMVEHTAVAEINGELKAFCYRYACLDADTPYCGEIYTFCVSKEAESTGIAEALLEEAEAILYISGFKVCKVWVPRDDTALCAFYAQNGFVWDGSARVVERCGAQHFRRFSCLLTRPDKKYYR